MLASWLCWHQEGSCQGLIHPELERLREELGDLGRRLTWALSVDDIRPLTPGCRRECLAKENVGSPALA